MSNRSLADEIFGNKKFLYLTQLTAENLFNDNEIEDKIEFIWLNVLKLTVK